MSFTLYVFFLFDCFNELNLVFFLKIWYYVEMKLRSFSTISMHTHYRFVFSFIYLLLIIDWYMTYINKQMV